MINRTIRATLALTLLLPFKVAMASDIAEYEPGRNVHIGSSIEEARKIGEAYIQFMTVQGTSENGPREEEVSQLFDTNLTKVENVAAILFNQSADLPKQLAEARKAVGTWKINKLDVIPSILKCVVHFTWSGERMPDLHTTMAILHLGKDGKITRIEEVYNKVNKKLVEK